MSDMSGPEQIEVMTPHVRTIGELSNKEPLQGSHVVNSKDEIPQDESVIYLNGGHTEYVPVKLLHDNSEIYYVKQTDKNTGEIRYARHAAIKVDSLIKNELFISNNDVKDELFKGIYQQLGQTSQTQRLEVLVGALKRSKTNPTNERAKESTQYLLGTIETVLENEYNQALAANKVLEAAGDYPTNNKARNITREQVDRILSGGSLEQQLSETRKAIKEAREAA